MRRKLRRLGRQLVRWLTARQRARREADYWQLRREMEAEGIDPDSDIQAKRPVVRWNPRPNDRLAHHLGNQQYVALHKARLEARRRLN